MGWSIGFDTNHNRDVGYGVPAICDQPGCGRHIDRGLSYVCGGEPYGGDEGCGLFFCGRHLRFREGKDQQVCERCAVDAEPFELTPDRLVWVVHKLADPTWAAWRAENVEAVTSLLSTTIERLDALPTVGPTPRWEGQFDTFDEWVSRASTLLTGRYGNRGEILKAICIDTKGRRCNIGHDFMRARDEEAFPIRFFWDCELEAEA